MKGTGTRTGLDRIRAHLAEPADGASLVFFRIAFGGILVVYVSLFFVLGWIEDRFAGPSFHFSYRGFGWVRVLPEPWLRLHFVALGLCALGILFGFYHRVCSALFTVGFAYVFLLEQAHYLNHEYLILLLTGLMVFLPADRSPSVDAHRNTKLQDPAIGAWALWCLRIQFGVVYFFAGVAKLNSDWLVRAEPLSSLLSARAGLPVVGSLITAPVSSIVFAWSAALLDLLVVPLLCWRRTRPFALAAAIGFHLTNSLLFQIDVFPFLMIAGTLLFCEPSWPREILGSRPVPVLARTPTVGRPAFFALALWLAFQLGAPLRHHLYPGPVAWNERGHFFSWRMLVRSKRGSLVYELREPGSQQAVTVHPHRQLTPMQARALIGRPDMILQYAHHLAATWPGERVEVRANARVSLNGREPRPLLDPEVDLAACDRKLAPFLVVPWSENRP